MRISSKSRHAISSMLELGTRNDKQAIALNELAETHNISISYLEQIFADLRTKGLVEGRRGPGGGYVLARDRSEISIADIICAVDEWVDYSFNSPRAPTVNQQAQTALGLWNKLSQQIYQFLSSITLDSVGRDNLALLDELAGDELEATYLVDQAA